MTNVLSIVGGLFSTAIRTLHPGFKLPKAFVQWNGGKFGDYQCMVALTLSQVCVCVCVDDYVCVCVCGGGGGAGGEEHVLL